MSHSLGQILLNGNCRHTAYPHVADQLLRHFLENLLSKIAASNRFVEQYELYNVTGAWSTHLVRQTATISIKLLHRAKVSISHTHNDD